MSTDLSIGYKEARKQQFRCIWTSSIKNASKCAKTHASVEGNASGCFGEYLGKYKVKAPTRLEKQSKKLEKILHRHGNVQRMIRAGYFLKHKYSEQKAKTPQVRDRGPSKRKILEGQPELSPAEIVVNTLKKEGMKDLVVIDLRNKTERTVAMFVATGLVRIQLQNLIFFC
jgi:hypothetical protein